MSGGFKPENMPENFDPKDFDPENMPEGMTVPEMPENFDPKDFDPENMPKDFDQNNRPQGGGARPGGRGDRGQMADMERSKEFKIEAGGSYFSSVGTAE